MQNRVGLRQARLHKGAVSQIAFMGFDTRWQWRVEAAIQSANHGVGRQRFDDSAGERTVSARKQQAHCNKVPS
jgi:hypothetical protein